MEVTEVKVKLVEVNRDRLKAFCTITLDSEFVVRDLKLIEGASGLFVAMPSRKLADRCPSCGGKNHLRARHCNSCGAGLNETRGGTDRDGRPKLHADIAHPINSSCRERIQKAVESAYHEEIERAKQPGYRPVSLDEDDTDYHPATGSAPAAAAPPAVAGQGSADEVGEDQGSADEAGTDQGSEDEAGEDQGSADEAGTDQDSAEEVGEDQGSADEAGEDQGPEDKETHKFGEGII